MRALAVLLLSLLGLFVGGCEVEGMVAGGKAPPMPPGFDAPISVEQNGGGFVRPGDSGPGNAESKAVAPTVTPGEVAPARAGRIVVYSAGLRLVVVSTADTMRTILKLTEQAGGYMDEQTGNAITVRVPAAKFNEIIAAIEPLGELVDRNIKAQDVTEQMLDLRTHLDTAEKTRTHLGDLLNKAEKVEDTLRIESELRRLSEEIEVTKNKIRMLESRVAMSAIRVELNATQPQLSRRGGLGLPFAWLEQIGDGLVAGDVKNNTREAGIFGAGPSFKTPAGFVRYFQSSEVTEAMDAADLRLKVHEHKNLDDGDIAFWTKLARRVLVESRALAVTGEKTDGNLSIIQGTREVGGKPYGYLMTLRRSKSKVVIYEAWGPKDQFDEAQKALEAAGKTTSGSGWW